MVREIMPANSYFEIEFIWHGKHIFIQDNTAKNPKEAIKNLKSDYDIAKIISVKQVRV